MTQLKSGGFYDGRLWLASNVSHRLAPRTLRPRDASVKLTENCQARCVTCDYWKHRWQDRIGTDAAVALIGRLGDIGVSTIRFTGGEPLLRRDFFDILARADTAPFTTVSLQTNGLLLRRLAERVNDSPITHVAVSLDAVDERNDEIRGVRGYFERALEGIALLRGKTVIIAMTLNQVGAGDLDVLIDHVERVNGYLACNLPDNRLYFLQDASLAGLWPDAETSDRIVDTLRRRLRGQFTDYELDYVRRYLRTGSPELGELNPSCVLGYTTVYVASDGAVRSGCYVLPPIGNILEQDIAEILDSPEYLRRCRAMLRLECEGCACNVFTSLRAKNAVQDRIRTLRDGPWTDAGDRALPTA
ncbi:MAG: radical SAM/SPASM domain-containing protein [Pseudonocardiaceae bacterium]